MWMQSVLLSVKIWSTNLAQGTSNKRADSLCGLRSRWKTLTLTRLTIIVGCIFWHYPPGKQEPRTTSTDTSAKALAVRYFSKNKPLRLLYKHSRVTATQIGEENCHKPDRREYKTLASRSILSEKLSEWEEIPARPWIKYEETRKKKT